MKAVLLLGRILFALIFVLSAPGHFNGSLVAYASSQGVPAAEFFVPLAGLFALLGGLSVLLGYKARQGAWLLVFFLAPVTLLMHRFWGVADPQMAMMQQINFMKNLSMLGGALVIAYYGSGPYSMDQRWRRNMVREGIPPFGPLTSSSSPGKRGLLR